MQSDYSTCTQCSAANLKDAKFCFRCGESLAQDQPQPPVAAAPIKKRSRLKMYGGLSFLGLVLIGTMLPEKKIESPKATALPTPTATQALTAAEKLIEAKRITSYGYIKEEYEKAFALLKDIPATAKEYREAQKQIEKLSATYFREEAAGPAPKTSAWNGVPYCIDRYLKQTLSDYDSAEYMGATVPRKVVDKKGTYWEVSVKLRAKNAFGAKIITTKTFYIQNEQVVEVR